MRWLARSGRRLWVAAVIATAVGAQACAPSDLPRPAVRRWGVVEDVETLPYSEVKLERRGCFGTCPAYTVTFRRDGTVSYQGGRYVDKLGEHTGRLPLEEFASLGHLLERMRFESLEVAYAAPRNPDTVVVSVTQVDGHTSAVLSSGRRGPPELWTLHRVIDGLLVHVRWDASAESASPARERLGSGRH